MDVSDIKLAEDNKKPICNKDIEEDICIDLLKWFIVHKKEIPGMLQLTDDPVNYPYLH